MSATDCRWYLVISSTSCSHCSHGAEEQRNVVVLAWGHVHTLSCTLFSDLMTASYLWQRSLCIAVSITQKVTLQAMLRHMRCWSTSQSESGRVHALAVAPGQPCQSELSQVTSTHTENTQREHENKLIRGSIQKKASFKGLGLLPHVRHKKV